MGRQGRYGERSEIGRAVVIPGPKQKDLFKVATFGSLSVADTKKNSRVVRFRSLADADTKERGCVVTFTSVWIIDIIWPTEGRPLSADG